MSKESVRQQAYHNLFGVVRMPAKYWYSVQHMFPTREHGYPVMLVGTYDEACRYGLEDQVLKDTENLKEEYEHLHRTL